MDETPSDGTLPPESDMAVPLDTLPLHSAGLLTVLDADGVVRYESPAVTRLFGYDQRALVDEPLDDYIHPEDRERVVETVHTLVTADERTVESVEYRHETAAGSYLWVESVGSSTPTPEGYYVINTRDIAAQKQREQELEAANERLQRFTRFVSHDLRNPLTIAQGYLALATEDADSEHHETVADALDRMDSLIERLLADARGGEPIVDREPVDLTALCEACWQRIETEASTLEVTVDRPISADRFRLKQLLENCLRNATEHNEGAVRISVGALDDGFYIADDGRGISAANHNRVFDTGYTTADSGTGFGLEIVSHVVDAHDWELTITESTAGGLRLEITGVQFTTTCSK